MANIIEKTKPKKKGTNPGDLSSIARLHDESRVAGGISPDYEKNYDQINWNSKKKVA